MNKIDDKKKVFWHEVGHLAASYYNHNRIGCYEVESMKIMWDENAQKYHASTKTVSLIGYSQDGPPIYPADRIASKAYGCIFQAIQQSSIFEHCFGQNHFADGYSDFKNINAIAIFLKNYKPSLVEEIMKCISMHFNKIKSNPEFAELFKMDISDLILSEEDEFSLDPKEILRRMAQFLLLHDQYYRELVDELNAIINASPESNY